MKLTPYLALAPVTSQTSDWDTLAGLSSDDLIQLRSQAHDPLTAQLIDSADASRYFELYVRYKTS